MERDGSNIEFFVCECHSDEHTLKYMFIDDDDFAELYTSVYLNNNFSKINYPYWLPDWLLYPIDNVLIRLRKVWRGLQYALGHTSKYGDFDCFLFDPRDCDRLIEYLQKYKQARADAKKRCEERFAQENKSGD